MGQTTCFHSQSRRRHAMPPIGQVRKARPSARVEERIARLASACARCPMQLWSCCAEVAIVFSSCPLMGRELACLLACSRHDLLLLLLFFAWTDASRVIRDLGGDVSCQGMQFV